MANFYENWLNLWHDEQEERAKARKSIHEEDLEWIRTGQDYRAALMCSREIGFTTAGAVMLAEIPQGWNTGKHSHGEEAIFIISGDGYSVVDGKRYNWDTGSCLFMPYGSVHQHFNSGDKKVRYLSTMQLALERFAGLAKVVQHEEARETPLGEPQGVEMAASDIHPEYGRVVLRAKDAPVVLGEDGKKTGAGDKSAPEKEMSAHGGGHEHSRLVHLMQKKENGFKAREVEITHIMCDAAGKDAPPDKHAHMEATIYILDGEGYSIIDDEKVEWKKGTLLHVQGPQTVHQHFNTGKVESQLLRIHYGIRSLYFQPIASRVFPYLHY